MGGWKADLSCQPCLGWGQSIQVKRGAVPRGGKSRGKSQGKPETDPANSGDREFRGQYTK